MPLQNSSELKIYHSKNSELLHEPREEKSTAPVVTDDIEESLTDLTLDDLKGTENDDEVIEAFCTEDEAARETRSPSKNVSGLSEFVSKRLSKFVSEASKPPSRKVSGTKRRSLETDRKIVAKMRSFSPSDVSLAGTSLVSDSFSPYDSFESYIAPESKPSPIPVWDHIGDYVKSVCAAAALVIDDNPAVAFSFNLTPEAIAKAKAKADPDGFLDALKRPFDQNLKRAGIDLDYFFAVDSDDDGRLHLHGGFRYPAPKLSINLTRRIRATMKKSWGEWTAPGKHRQLHFQTLRDDDWATYSLRHIEQVQKIIGPRSFTITQDLGKRARWVYEKFRSLMRE